MQQHGPDERSLIRAFLIHSTLYLSLRRLKRRQEEPPKPY